MVGSSISVVTEDDFVMVGTQKIKVTAAVPSDLTSSANSESVLGAAANSCTLTEDSLPDYSPIFHNLRELYQVKVLIMECRSSLASMSHWSLFTPQ